MSGRVVVQLADGRRVRGYRKTLVQRAPRTPGHLLPDWQLSFLLPDDMRFFGLPEGHVPGLVCVRIEAIACLRRAVVTGKNREFVLRRGIEFIHKVAPTYTSPISAILERGEDKGSTISGPIRPAETHPCQIRAGLHGEGTVTFATSMRPLRVEPVLSLR